jgi:uncharacterized protein YjbJ (UPF0337 family)
MGEHTDKIKGKAKQVAADLIDDDELHSEGEADEAAGKAKGRVDNVADGFKNAIDRVKKKLS